MSIQRRLIYMVMGGILALSLFVGGFAVFAQSGDGGESEETTVPETEPEAGTAENGADESSAEPSEGTMAVPFGHHFGFRSFAIGGDSEALAEALGITVEELEAAYETAAAAAVEQAVEEGLMTQEEADLLLARQAVQDYIDNEAVSEALQAAYEAAVADALAAGAITQEQADLMLENTPTFDGFGGFDLGFGGRAFHHGPGGRGHHGGPGFGGPANGSFTPSFEIPIITEFFGA